MATPRDLSWRTDLIWHYFGTVTTSAGPGRFNQYFKNQDPLGLLNNRRHVYDLLVGGTTESQPSSDAEVAKSTIPWNQNNEGFLKAVNQQWWCGSLIKMVFIRYMGWKDAEPSPQHSTRDRKFDAASWTIGKLEKKVPVRAFLGGHHYVGIVGHRKFVGPVATAGGERPTDFLCIDTWAWGIDAQDGAEYAGSKSAFLGIIKQNGKSWTYGKAAHLVTAVEVPPGM